MKIGYIRVSTKEQNTARQDELMEQLGVERVYIDKESGKNLRRTALMNMLEYAREGDTIVVSEISRFARNTKDLLELLETLKRKGIAFESMKEKIDTNTPTGQFMLTVFGAVAELEREYILARQREGIEIAKREHKYTGRKPIEVSKEEFEIEYHKWKGSTCYDRYRASDAMRKLRLKPNTWYRMVKEYETQTGRWGEDGDNAD